MPEITLFFAFGLGLLWAVLIIAFLHNIWVELKWHNLREEKKASLTRGVDFHLQPPLPPK